MMSAGLIATSALVVSVLGACGTGAPPVGSGSAGSASATSGPPCVAAGPKVDLGALAYDQVPTRHVRTRAGWYRIAATGFLHGGLLDPPVGRTTVVWGLASTPPVYHSGPSTVSGTLATTDVVEGQASLVKLPAATLWFLNTYGARLTLQGCSPATPRLVPAG
jgi:hypothetical protein